MHSITYSRLIQKALHGLPVPPHNLQTHPCFPDLCSSILHVVLFLYDFTRADSFSRISHLPAISSSQTDISLAYGSKCNSALAVCAKPSESPSISLSRPFALLLFHPTLTTLTLSLSASTIQNVPGDTIASHQCPCFSCSFPVTSYITSITPRGNSFYSALQAY